MSVAVTGRSQASHILLGSVTVIETMARPDVTGSNWQVTAARVE